MWCKKAQTRKWLKKDKQKINEWNDVIYNIDVMERITFKLRKHTDIFGGKCFFFFNGSAMCGSDLISDRLQR